MSYYDLTKEEQAKKNVDYDLCACLEYNSQPFSLDDVDRVLAVWEGENDGDDWRWVIRLNKNSNVAKENGRFAFLQGGCDYTGWDCQSWGKTSFAKTALKAAEYSKTGPDGATIQDAVMGMGLGRMISVMSGEYMNNTNAVYDSLVEQITTIKKETWRQQKDKQFGL